MRPTVKVFACTALLVYLAGTATEVGAQMPATHAPLQRLYGEGQVLTYRMTGVNEAWHYAVEARGVVKKNAAGAFYEDFAWSKMTTDGKPQALSPATSTYTQRLSLDPVQFPGAPDLSGVDPKMVGPITDLMTFYVDDWLASKFNQLTKPGDHFYFSNPMVPSWADGQHVILGEDAIDFDMTLISVDTATGTAELEVRHVPPPQAKVHLVAPWMQVPVAGQANNWVEVTKTGDGHYLAAVGMETFDVHITVDLADGRILKGTMQNPVKSIERRCTDEALTQCGDAQSHDILRTVAIELQP